MLTLSDPIDIAAARSAKRVLLILAAKADDHMHAATTRLDRTAAAVATALCLRRVVELDRVIRGAVN